MLRQISLMICGGLLLTICGACSSMGENSSQQSQSTMAPPQDSGEHLAAFAASTPYPTNLKTENAHNIGAVVDPTSRVIRIFNFGSMPLSGVNVWVDSSYVYKLDQLPANSFVNTNMSDYFDHSGDAMGPSTTVSTVQIQTPDHLWTLLGPIVQGS